MPTIVPQRRGSIRHHVPSKNRLTETVLMRVRRDVSNEDVSLGLR